MKNEIERIKAKLESLRWDLSTLTPAERALLTK